PARPGHGARPSADRRWGHRAGDQAAPRGLLRGGPRARFALRPLAHAHSVALTRAGGPTRSIPRPGGAVSTSSDLPAISTPRVDKIGASGVPHALSSLVTRLVERDSARSWAQRRLAVAQPTCGVDLTERRSLASPGRERKSLAGRGRSARGRAA